MSVTNPHRQSYGLPLTSQSVWISSTLNSTGTPTYTGERNAAQFYPVSIIRGARTEESDPQTVWHYPISSLVRIGAHSLTWTFHLKSRRFLSKPPRCLSTFAPDRRMAAGNRQMILFNSQSPYGKNVLALFD